MNTIVLSRKIYREFHLIAIFIHSFLHNFITSFNKRNKYVFFFNLKFLLDSNKYISKCLQLVRNNFRMSEIEEAGKKLN